MCLNSLCWNCRCLLDYSAEYFFSSWSLWHELSKICPYFQYWFELHDWMNGSDFGCSELPAAESQVTCYWCSPMIDCFPFVVADSCWNLGSVRESPNFAEWLRSLQVQMRHSTGYVLAPTGSQMLSGSWCLVVIVDYTDYVGYIDYSILHDFQICLIYSNSPDCIGYSGSFAENFDSAEIIYLDTSMAWNSAALDQRSGSACTSLVVVC